MDINKIKFVPKANAFSDVYAKATGMPFVGEMMVAAAGNGGEPDFKFTEVKVIKTGEDTYTIEATSNIPAPVDNPYVLLDDDPELDDCEGDYVAAFNAKVIPTVEDPTKWILDENSDYNSFSVGEIEDNCGYIYRATATWIDNSVEVDGYTYPNTITGTWTYEEAQPTYPNMLHFTAQEANSTIHLGKKLSGNLAPVLYKSTDGINFESWDGSEITLENVGDTVWMYGDNVTFGKDMANYTRFSMTGLIAGAGDITYLFKLGGTTEFPSIPFGLGYSGGYRMTRLFSSCQSLTSAPELPIAVLEANCYANMFAVCSNLQSVTCLATDISAQNCTQNWMNGVSATGTFTKSPDMSSWTTGTSGIPEGWTVENKTI